MKFGLLFVDGEIPARVNSQLFLQNIPAEGSLLLFRNGLLMRPEFGDYRIAAGQIVVPTPAPEDSDRFIAFYRLIE